MDVFEAEVLAILARVSKRRIEDLRPDQDLVADLSVDSMLALELLCDVEEALGVEFPDDAISDLDTVGDLLEVARRFRSSEVAQAS